MDEITIGDKVYVSSKRAAKITGYAKDYVGQLCREGRVEARLVGRNWYVLESSIREHRFGQPELAVAQKEEIPASPVSQWSAPRYEAVTAPVMPAFAPKEAERPVTASISEEIREEITVSLTSAESEKVVEDMQEAWKEWFSRREEELPDALEDVVEEDLPTATSEQPPEDSETEPDTAEEEDEDGEDEQEEEVIAIHRTHSPLPEPEYVPRRASVVDLSPKKPMIQSVHVAEEAREVYKAPGRRVQIAPKKRQEESTHTDGSMVIKAVFLSVAALAAVIAFIGSGYADSVLHLHGSGAQQGVVDYLQGASTVDK